MTEVNATNEEPLLGGDVQPIPLTQSPRYVRLALYGHVAVIVLAAVLTMSDSGHLELPDIVWSLFAWRIIQWPFAFSWMVSPGLTAAAVYQYDCSQAYRNRIIAFDVFLSLFQLWVMLPMVQ